MNFFVFHTRRDVAALYLFLAYDVHTFHCFLGCSYFSFYIYFYNNKSVFLIINIMITITGVLDGSRGRLLSSSSPLSTN